MGIDDEKLKGSIGGTKHKLISLSFIIRPDIFLDLSVEQISNFVVGSILSRNPINFKHILFLFKIAGKVCYSSRVKLGVNFSFGLFQKFLGQVSNITKFSFEAEVDFLHRVGCNNAESLLVFHEASDKKLIVCKVIDLCQIEFDVLRQLTETQSFGIFDFDFNFFFRCGLVIQIFVSFLAIKLLLIGFHNFE